MGKKIEETFNKNGRALFDYERPFVEAFRKKYEHVLGPQNPTASIPHAEKCDVEMIAAYFKRNGGMWKGSEVAEQITKLLKTSSDGVQEVKCDECKGVGEIYYRRGQTPESYEEGSDICPHCHGIGTVSTQQTEIIEAVDAAMVEMANISPPLRRSECERLIRAALSTKSTKKMTSANDENQWRKLALQFDGHRMQALWHLKSLLKDPLKHAEEAQKFVNAAPLSGETVLAERIAALAQSTSQGTDVNKLHANVMNLSANVDRTVFANWSRAEQDAYCAGYRDARHAAAELVLTSKNKEQK